MGAMKEEIDGWFEITDEQLAILKDKVVVLTGGSSGIGLATVNLLLSLGAKVVTGDLNPPPTSTADNPNLTFVKTDVTSWSDLSNLFKTAATQHGRIDHAFANAGIGGTSDPFDEKLDPTTGELLEPGFKTYDVNLRGVVNTSALAFHYMRRQDHPGSVVLTCSSSAFQRFSIVDYAAAKHGVLGFMRGCVPLLTSHRLADRIRVNSVAPSWTVTGILPEGWAEAAGTVSQTPDTVARSVALLMADQHRNGQLIYIIGGRYREIEESVFLPTMQSHIFGSEPGDNEIMEKIKEHMRQQAKDAGKESGK